MGGYFSSTPKPRSKEKYELAKCCCCSLRTGSLLTGSFIAAYGICCSYDCYERLNAEDGPVGLTYFVGFMSYVCIVMGIVFLIFAYKKKIKFFKPFMIFLIVYAIVQLVDLIMMFTSRDEVNLVSLVSIIVYLVCAPPGLLCVRSYYFVLKYDELPKVNKATATV